MLTRKVLASIARRYDTAMSRAMLRALGVVARPEARAVPKPCAKRVWDAKFQGMSWCFENHGSPCR